MTIKSTQDFWTGLAFLAFGAFTVYQSGAYPLGTAARMGPGYFPTALGLILAGVGLVTLVRSVASAAGGQAGAIDVWLVARLLAAIAAFGLLLNPMGFFVAAFVAVMLAAWAGPEFRLGEALILAAGLTVGSWLLFIKGLKQTMPVLPAFLG